ncbi:MAG: hypothetical protein ACFFBD_09360, partial [Candidatus Hodarchaeota archaeon]
MVKGGLDPKLVSRLEQVEQALFGGKLEDKFFQGKPSPVPLFNDTLEKITFLIILDFALEGKAGVTSALLADLTHKTKNTINVRLER